MGTKRTMISLPADLKERMEKSGDKVNWSAVARKAFEDTLAEVEQPCWSEVEIQVFNEELAGDVISMDQFVEDNNMALGCFMTNCKEGRHGDPQFRNWYQEMRMAAHEACMALENLQTVANRYSSEE